MKKKQMGWKIFAIAVGIIVIMGLGKPAVDNVKDLFSMPESTEDSKESTLTNAAFVDDCFEVC